MSVLQYRVHSIWYFSCRDVYFMFVLDHGCPKGTEQNDLLGKVKGLHTYPAKFSIVLFNFIFCIMHNKQWRKEKKKQIFPLTRRLAMNQILLVQTANWLPTYASRVSSLNFVPRCSAKLSWPLSCASILQNVSHFFQERLYGRVPQILLKVPSTDLAPLKTSIPWSNLGNILLI